MYKEVQLPDYLPARYDNWLDLYLSVIKEFEKSNIEINEETEVRLYEGFSYEEIKELGLEREDVIDMYQKFPLTLIKARAFDFIIERLPKFKEMYEVERFAYAGCQYYSSSQAESSHIFELLKGLLDITKYNR